MEVDTPTFLRNTQNARLSATSTRRAELAFDLEPMLDNNRSQILFIRLLFEKRVA